MYNEELKERFLSSVTESENTRNVYRNIFSSTEKTEIALGKDVSAMTPEEGREIAAQLVGLRGESRVKRLYLLKQYVRWCVREGIEGATLDFLEVTANSFAGIREKMVSGPEDLKRRLDGIFGKTEEDTVRNTYRCYLWLGYMGVPESGAVALRTENVDLNSRTVEAGGKTYPIPDAAMPDFRSCATLTEFVFAHPGYNRISYLKRYGGEELLRGIRSAPAVQNMRVSVVRAQKESDGNLTYGTLAMSGLFRNTFERERAGVEPDFSGIARQEAEDAVKRNGTKSGPYYLGQRAATIETTMRKDYERWKFIFT